MQQTIALVTLVVRDYDEAIAFFTQTLKFVLVEDTYVPEQDKRWVVVAPPGAGSTGLVLGRASTDEQRAAVGRQTGGRVAFFLRTDDFWRDHRDLVTAGVTFVRAPRVEPYGTVAVFADLYGNLWDLVGPGEP
ncbi:MAG TPA: VOC family protein [Vicinamibacterales bacterium]|nr:VOC family protein [Vicinamibacterales bacterium]